MRAGRILPAAYWNIRSSLLDYFNNYCVLSYLLNNTINYEGVLMSQEKENLALVTIGLNSAKDEKCEIIFGTLAVEKKESQIIISRWKGGENWKISSDYLFADELTARLNGKQDNGLSANQTKEIIASALSPILSKYVKNKFNNSYDELFLVLGKFYSDIPIREVYKTHAEELLNIQNKINELLLSPFLKGSFAQDLSQEIKQLEFLKTSVETDWTELYNLWVESSKDVLELYRKTTDEFSQRKVSEESLRNFGENVDRFLKEFTLYMIMRMEKKPDNDSLIKIFSKKFNSTEDFQEIIK